jgi:hypothetical protein
LVALAGPGSIFALAAALRIGMVFASQGGPTGNFGYDPSVYYAAADSFIHGRMPYRDFVLLHPPGVMLALSPFAALGRLTTDLTGFGAGNMAFALLGALNAVLIYRIVLRLGLSRTAAWLGGAFYAVWYGSTYAELSSRLEPLGNFAFLCGVLALTNKREEHRLRSVLLAGAGFGCALSVKLWWGAPLLLVALWLACSRDGWRRALAFTGGAAAAAAVVDGPFFLMAPSAMWHMVVTDQLSRNSLVSIHNRLVSLSTLEAAHTVRGGHITAVALGFAVVLVLLCAAAWRVRAARMFVVLALLQTGVILVSPPFFHFYLDYLAVPYALVVAAAAHSRSPRLPARVQTMLAGAVVVGAACITAVGGLANAVPFIKAFPTDQLADDLPPHPHCVMSLAPMALIELNALSSDLGNNCAQWVDATGRTYSVDALPHGPDYHRRPHNMKWQADVLHYLQSGNFFVMVGNFGGLNPKTVDELHEDTLLVHSDGDAAYAVVPIRDRFEPPSDKS